MRFSEVITTERALRDVVGHPVDGVTKKTIDVLDQHARTFIGRSPFLLLSTCNNAGQMDISPRGDPPGFVKILDDKTIAIPDRLGNSRVDSFTNLLENPRLGLLFMIPGKKETLRISGSSVLVRDESLLDTMKVNDRAPQLALVVTVEELFFHCSKCMVRSKLWNPDVWPSLEGLPTLAQTMVDAGELAIGVDQMEQLVDFDAKNRLY